MQYEDHPIEEKWAVMFPGQGSQFIGMGKDFYAESQSSRDIYTLANDIAKKDITKLCFNGPISKLSNTDNLQISITATNLAISDFLFSNTNIKPSIVLGHSVGEYSALQLASCLRTEDALKITLKRGQFMQAQAKLEKGQMYALKNILPADVQTILNNTVERNAIVIANDNSNQQQVVSGEKSAMSNVLTYCAENNIEAVKLPVSGAWHSMLMQGCVENFHESLLSIHMQEPKITYINNMTAQSCSNVAHIKENLVSHITGMVRWRESIEGLINTGHRKFIEVGPKKVLTRLLESIAGDTSNFTIEHVESLQDVERIASI